MNKKLVVRAMSVALCGVMGFSALSSFTACGKKKDSIVLMTEELSGLFNPFYATSGTDMDVVGMTQIGMLSTDKNGDPVAGDDEPTVVKAFDWQTTGTGENAKTVYTFVIKNGLKFSDGKPLTMNDVFFNMYEYLDPVYTGSSTMYSIDIEGLKQYRTQRDTEEDDDTHETAMVRVGDRLRTLRSLYQDEVDSRDVSGLHPNEMEELISEATIDYGYKVAVSSEKQINGKDGNEETLDEGQFTDDDYRAILLEDYKLTLKTFKEELELDYKAAKEAFDLTTAPYAEHKKLLENDIFKFFLYEDYIKPVYAKIEGTNRDDEQKILSFEQTHLVDTYNTMEKAIEYVYDNAVYESLDDILRYWRTAGTLQTLYTAEAIDIMLNERIGEDGLEVKNISGIVSLGHTTNETSVSFKDRTTGEQVSYNVARTHNADGTPTNANEYDVLQVTVNGTDPKAIYNFGFSVAPAHIYSGKTIKIEENQFGVDWASSEFQTKVVQSQRNVEVPVGAGAYMATDLDNNDNPAGNKFWESNIVYYKANPYFMFPVKTEKVRMQVISSTNAIAQLEKGAVDFISPQFTKTNAEQLQKLEKKGIKTLSQWQLGYGYIGINAGKVPDINVRRAIMSAMDVSLSLDYYLSGTVETIDWPMSNQSWAYPKDPTTGASKLNDVDYMQWLDVGKDANGNALTADAEKDIKKYMALARNGAGVSKGDEYLKIRFTIAGASITEHPTYAVFKQAAELLNKLGWDVEVKADSQALTKLSTGSLAVWAAAWGSTIDPDMYQVYHKNSTATSVYAWGYREILADTDTYSEEYDIITDLSELIDQGREYMDRVDRIPIYESAMRKVLELAVEMPVYQRQNLYAYNSKNVKGFPDKLENAYASPTENIWELELVK